MIPKNQRQAILMHMANGGVLTTIEATKKQFGYCTKLPTRLSEYQKEGFIFIREKVNTKNIFNEPIYYYKYSIDLKKTSKKLIKSICN